MNSTGNNTNERTFWDNAIMKLPTDAPRASDVDIYPADIIRNAVMTVSGSIESAEKRTGQESGNEYVAIKFRSVLGDKSVHRYFGDIVRQDHSVTFEFNLTGYNAKNFLAHPPLWGQHIVVQLDMLEVNEFTRKKTGEVDHSVRAHCNGIFFLGQKYSFTEDRNTGTIVKSERKPVTIFGVGSNGNAGGNQNGTSQAATSGSGAQGGGFYDLPVDAYDDDDGELPF